MAEDGKESPHCSLDQNGCLQLSCILRAFNAPVSEEQAWAVCFQSAKCMVNEWNSDYSSCYLVSDTAHIFIHKDGTVHRNTVRLPVINGLKRKLATSEYTLVASLGVIVFNALDYGLCHDEERKLSPPLERLIDHMTSADTSVLGECEDGEGGESICSDDGKLGDEDMDTSSQNADEGIEQDSGEDDQRISESFDEKHVKGLTFVKVMELCACHLSCPGQADSHYKAVCRALVAEVLELSSFLENISNGKKSLLSSAPSEADSRTLEKLKIQDWARLWMQVIQQLRQGVKLKKVDPAQIAHPIEYELTPYEMILDDIRSRRYKLKQVMVNGDIPQRVKKDAHALILEFIRSRPPLVPVSKRKLPPTPPRQLNLYEKLMQSIKQQPKLRPTGKNSPVETSRTKLQDNDITPQPHRRLIKVDLALRLSSSFEDDELDDVPNTPGEEPQSLPLKPNSRKSSLTRSNSHSGATNDRRHSITVCESPPKPCNGTIHGRSSHSLDRAAKSDYWKCSQWQSLECLSLTLEEVVHIRNVLTKVELESLITDPVLYEDVVKGKVCFTCKRIRFSFFGPWGIKCKMCERTVCDKCSSKMRIPTEHFARIPVYMLSPTPSPPPESESSHTFWRLPDVLSFPSHQTGDQHITPKLSHQLSVNVANGSNKRNKFRHSESVHVFSQDKIKNSSFVTPKKRIPLQRSKTIQESHDSKLQKNTVTQEEKLKGPLAPVCRECKVLVSNIIKTSQDKNVPCEEKPKNNLRTWSHKRKNSGTAASCMSPVAETPPCSPDDVFANSPVDSIRQHIPSFV